MKFVAFALASLAAAPPSIAQPSAEAALSLDQRTALRCAATFALTAQAQARGEASAVALPPLAERGREYFVRFSARLMDDTGMAREQVAALLAREAQALVQSGGTANALPPCLTLLDLSGI
ncbi:MAG: hypothetical protein B7X57_04510 [Erythrobacter sp. 34-65-8]|nr:MAG: hypothetical protein B7X57_04510 [Erythrobacter sp. 34-65-8]